MTVTTMTLSKHKYPVTVWPWLLWLYQNISIPWPCDRDYYDSIKYLVCTSTEFQYIIHVFIFYCTEGMPFYDSITCLLLFCDCFIMHVTCVVARISMHVHGDIHACFEELSSTQKSSLSTEKSSLSTEKSSLSTEKSSLSTEKSRP